VIKVLVVDDSALMRKALGGILRAAGDMEVAVARNGLEAIEQLHGFGPDVVTLDIHMPEMDGLACLDRIMIERPCRVVMVASLTAAEADVTLEAMALGAVDFVAKPDGVISLALDAFAPVFLERVRAASHARLRTAVRLAERVRLRAARATPAPVPPPRPPGRVSPPQPRHSIVLVGTSTGGPPALDALLSPLPADFPWPILIAQHMPAAFTGPLARRLDRLCALDVVEVAGPTAILPGTVYVARGDADMILSTRPDGPIAMAVPADPALSWHPSVERLVATAMAQIEPGRLIGVLMTGMGNDGAAGMARLRALGGRTIAEAEETAIVWGMPGELVRAGGAELVAPLGDIARHLMNWAA
jgi:two-component system, chemotaxis family, protein-glutamate methylesterase/glutaminase